MVAERSSPRGARFRRGVGTESLLGRKQSHRRRIHRGRITDHATPAEGGVGRRLPIPNTKERGNVPNQREPRALTGSNRARATHLSVLLADDDAVRHGHLPALLRLEPSQRGGVVQSQPGGHPPDLVAPHVYRPRGQERRVAVEELHVPVLVLGHLRRARADREPASALGPPRAGTTSRTWVSYAAIDTIPVLLEEHHRLQTRLSSLADSPC